MIFNPEHMALLLVNELISQLMYLCLGMYKLMEATKNILTIQMQPSPAHSTTRLLL